MTVIGKNDCTPISVLRKEEKPFLWECFPQSKMTTISESKGQVLLTFLQGKPTATQALKWQNLELFVNSDATQQPWSRRAYPFW
jgi:hypothetical protein